MALGLQGRGQKRYHVSARSRCSVHVYRKEFRQRPGVQESGGAGNLLEEGAPEVRDMGLAGGGVCSGK